MGEQAQGWHKTCPTPPSLDSTGTDDLLLYRQVASCDALRLCAAHIIAHEVRCHVGGSGHAAVLGCICRGCQANVFKAVTGIVHSPHTTLYKTISWSVTFSASILHKFATRWKIIQSIPRRSARRSAHVTTHELCVEIESLANQEPELEKQADNEPCKCARCLFARGIEQTHFTI